MYKHHILEQTMQLFPPVIQILGLPMNEVGFNNSFHSGLLSTSKGRNILPQCACENVLLIMMLS